MRGRSSSAAAASASRERRRKTNSTSPLKDRTRTTSSKLSSQSELSSSPSATTLLDRDPSTALFGEYSNSNPRSFPHNVKQKCWEKADKVKGRDPDRWRRDPLGNLIFRKLVGCPGCLCHDYDHILPYSKVFLFLLSGFTTFSLIVFHWKLLMTTYQGFSLSLNK